MTLSFWVYMDAGYVYDSNNSLIRKIDIVTGMVSTIAGSTEGYLDGYGTSAKFFRPTGICGSGQEVASCWLSVKPSTDNHQQ